MEQESSSLILSDQEEETGLVSPIFLYPESDFKHFLFLFLFGFWSDHLPAHFAERTNNGRQRIYKPVQSKQS